MGSQSQGSAGVTGELVRGLQIWGNRVRSGAGETESQAGIARSEFDRRASEFRGCQGVWHCAGKEASSSAGRTGGGPRAPGGDKTRVRGVGMGTWGCVGREHS